LLSDSSSDPGTTEEQRRCKGSHFVSLVQRASKAGVLGVRRGLDALAVGAASTKWGRPPMAKPLSLDDAAQRNDLTR
jgi:hypothetical protein